MLFWSSLLDTSFSDFLLFISYFFLYPTFSDFQFFLLLDFCWCPTFSISCFFWFPNFSDFLLFSIQEVGWFFLFQEVGWFFFVPRGWVISFCPERLGDFFLSLTLKKTSKKYGTSQLNLIWLPIGVKDFNLKLVYQ